MKVSEYFIKSDYHSSAVCQLDLGSKQDIVRRERRCWLCLHKLCRKNNCSSNIKCSYCKSRSHNQAFCFDYHKFVNLEKKEGSDAVVSNVAYDNSEINLLTAAGQFIGRKGSPTKHIYPKVRIRVKSLISNKEIVIEALETKQLSSAHISIPAKEVREKFESLGLALADVPAALDKGACEIGLLVGSDNYWKFVVNRIEKLDESLVAVETIFGFCIHGSVSEDKDNDETSVNLVKSKESIPHQLNQFWQLENLGIEVAEDIKDISENEILKSFEFSIKYSDKTTTKIRIVFDGSSHGENQLSLNDCLNSGVNLNPDLLELILKFRENPIAYTADIEKAFLQIELHEQDRDVARFFWTENLNDYDPKNLQVYRLTRVLFGLTSSPFMLAATIRHHLKKYKDKFPDTAKIVESSLYVDDFISGQENVDKALQTSLESIEIFKGKQECRLENGIQIVKN
ncbi:DUF1758 domain-containing protein [Trichonephila clavata]|uniref:DUF1758 domain-containing protein n=1 Tax=Trichonephila clavata TaxID=2740835 RepID=A0A8X6LN50_TRICU|nr:DUF1758 domain-containing protein [Trichonephila clavata]